MKLEVLKCPSCGANIEIEEYAESCECEYCGATITIAPTKNTTTFENITPKSTIRIKQKNKKTQTGEVIGETIRKVFNILFISCLFLTGFSTIMFFIDMDAMGFGIVLFFAIYSVMFKVLSLTPKKSNHILGKTKGIKPIYFVLLCVLLSFAVIMMSATSSEAPSEIDTTSDTSITTNIDVN